jgi:hypothetical protein
MDASPRGRKQARGGSFSRSRFPLCCRGKRNRIGGGCTSGPNGVIFFLPQPRSPVRPRHSFLTFPSATWRRRAMCCLRMSHMVPGMPWDSRLGPVCISHEKRPRQNNGHHHGILHASVASNFCTCMPAVDIQKICSRAPMLTPNRLGGLPVL